jgi:sugar phosphate isomerase/epimerase
MDRRGFVGVMGSVAAGVAGCHREPAERPPLLGRLGAQLYTVRNAMTRDFEGTLGRVREIGYEDVEFAGYFGRSPRQVRDVLRAVGLAAPAAHVELAAIEGDWPRTLAAAAEIGHEYLVLAWFAAERRRTSDDWRRLASALGRAGEESRGAGLRLAYHNHDYEFIPVDGSVPLELLLAGTDPADLAFELDVYWMTKAGHDPREWIGRGDGRFELLHLKDSAGPPDHAMVDVGAGAVDWPRTIAAAQAAGARHLFVEHDEPGDGLDSLRASYDYLRRLPAGRITPS